MRFVIFEKRGESFVKLRDLIFTSDHKKKLICSRNITKKWIKRLQQLFSRTSNARYLLKCFYYNPLVNAKSTAARAHVFYFQHFNRNHGLQKSKAVFFRRRVLTVQISQLLKHSPTLGCSKNERQSAFAFYNNQNNPFALLHPIAFNILRQCVPTVCLLRKSSSAIWELILPWKQNAGAIWQHINFSIPSN